jgi:hypothetical protein
MKNNFYGVLVLIIQIFIISLWLYDKLYLSTNAHIGDIASFGLLHVVTFINLIFLLIFWWKNKILKDLFIWKFIFLIAILCVLWLIIGWIKIFITEGFPMPNW